MNRREFLQCGALLVSGLSASQLGFSLTEEQQAYLCLLYTSDAADD